MVMVVLVCIGAKHIPWQQRELFACTETFHLLLLANLQIYYKLFLISLLTHCIWMSWSQLLHNNHSSPLFTLPVTLPILQAIKHDCSANYPRKHRASLRSLWAPYYLLKCEWSAFSSMHILSSSSHQRERWRGEKNPSELCQVMPQPLLWGSGLILRTQKQRWGEAKSRWSSRMRLRKKTEI